MVDDNLNDTAAEKPLAQLADTERALDAGGPAGADPVDAGPAPPQGQDFAHAPDNPAPLTAAERVRAFEDETFGADAVRVDGHIERGSGSRFQELTIPQRRHYAALQALVPAEIRLSEAKSAVISAEAAYAAALDAVEQSSKEI